MKFFLFLPNIWLSFLIFILCLDGYEYKFLNQIIQAVQAAPNWVNLPHTSIVAAKDSERRKKFATLCGEQEHTAQAPVFLVFCADFYRTWLTCRETNQNFEQITGQIDNLIVGANEVGIALGTAVARRNLSVSAPFLLETSVFMRWRLWRS